MSEYREAQKLRHLQRVALSAALRQRERILARHKAKLKRQDLVIENLRSVDWATGQKVTADGNANQTHDAA
jgi:hypothetical protein